jgi:hypothetical protein
MKRYLPIILIVCLLITFRVLGSAFPNALPNFQPLAAVFFCGALLAPGWRGFAIPLGVWAVTFPLGFGHTGSPAVFLTTLLAFAVIFFFGKSLSTKGIPSFLLGSVGAAAIFHGITCVAAWIGDPAYAKSLTGLWGSLWTGYPYPVPSWVFLRNLAAANMLFTGLFVLARFRLPKLDATAPTPAPTPALAKIR